MGSNVGSVGAAEGPSVGKSVGIAVGGSAVVQNRFGLYWQERVSFDLSKSKLKRSKLKYQS